MFIERAVNITPRPIAVCTSFHALQASVNRIDWRAAWAAESDINRVLVDAMEKIMHARADDAMDR